MRRTIGPAAAVLAALAVSTGHAAAAHGAGCHALRTCPANHYEYVWRGLRCAAPKLADPAKDTTAVRWRGARWLCHRAASAGPPSRGTRSNPYALGASAPVAAGRWTFRIDSVTPDATQQILDAEPADDPPAPGHQFFLVHVTAAFDGPGTTVAWEDLLGALQAVGSSQVAYNQTDTGSCGTLPDDIADVEQVFSGATVTGNVCWSVTAADAATLLVFWFDSATQQPSVWFSPR